MNNSTEIWVEIGSVIFPHWSWLRKGIPKYTVFRENHPLFSEVKKLFFKQKAIESPLFQRFRNLYLQRTGEVSPESELYTVSPELDLESIQRIKIMALSALELDLEV